MAALNSLTELNNILSQWDEETYTEGLATTDPVPKLTRLCELFELETEAYYKMDPDPFDDRHPGRANPTCALGHLFKALFKNEEFMNRLVVSYVLNPQRNLKLNTVSCRLLYDILPGLETSVVFSETEGLVEQLVTWAENAEEPLRTYAIGLLAGAMEVQDVASNFKEKNSALVPILLQRLHSLQREMHEEYQREEAALQAENKRYFSMFGSPGKMSSSSHSVTTPPKYSKQPAGATEEKKSETDLEKQKSTENTVAVKDKALYDTCEDRKESKSTGKVPEDYVLDRKENKIVSDIKLNRNTGEDSEKLIKTDTTEILKNEGSVDRGAINGIVLEVKEHTNETGARSDPKDSVASSRIAESEQKDSAASSNSSQIQHKNGVVVCDSQIPCCSTDTGGNKLNESKTLDTENKDGSPEVQGRKSDITLEERKARLKHVMSPSFYREEFLQNKSPRTHTNSFLTSDVSNSSWAEIEPYVIGSYKLEPLSLGMKQRLILQYLTPMGEYQELISAAFEHRAMDLVFYYINLKYNKDVRLAFEALKYLAVLLCHKKFAIEFLQRGGVQKLLDVYRPSIAATGVSLCLYYLSYFEDAMERVCLLSDHVLTTLVSYVLWLIECSHDSSRCHAAMFFLQSFPFHVILSKFDAHDGLRRLFNVISTIEILNIESTATLTDDQLFTMRQTVRHVCVAFKKYFESHLILKVKELQRSHTRNEGGSPHHETPAYKAMRITPDAVQENIELMMELMPVRQLWQPEATFHRLGGITLLSQLVAMAPDWSSYTGKPETIKAALDVIGICCVTPRSQLALLQAIPLPENVTTFAISIFIGLAEGEIMPDADVQKSALSIIINCVCGPLERLGGGVGRYMGVGSSKKKVNSKLGEDVLSKMWKGVRENNGIMVLLKLLLIKMPMTDADSIRALACKALVGMARSETLRQIISKLPLFSTGQLQLLMKEPVLQDKHLEHVKFCKYATALIEKVSGKETNRYSDATLDDIRKADIVAQSKIIYNKKELLQLIYDHLLASGYQNAAEVLQRDAELTPHCCTPPPMLPGNAFPPVHPANTSMFSSPMVGPVTPRPMNRSMTSAIAGPSQSAGNVPLAATPFTVPQIPSTPTSNPGHIKFTMNKGQLTSPQASNTALKARCKYVKEEKEGILFSPAIKKEFLHRSQPMDYDISLDKIVTEYLRKQHALCPNPVVTCPPMSLFRPHQCPEPRGYNCAPYSFTARMARKMIQPKYGGMDGLKLDRKFIYSRFKAVKTYKEPEDEGYFSCTFANLSSTHSYLILGTYSGSLKLINTESAEETGSFKCHSSPVSHVEHSRDGKLVLTSSNYGILNSSSLWSWGADTLDVKFYFEDQHLEFSKHVQDRLIGTQDEVANIYDISTGKKIVKLYDSEKANNYKANRAIFNPTDDFVLNDGVLWDVRTCKAIHKFDKFNQYVSGDFHPAGLEIIINSEVWDLRTFKLLHTVPSLDQCQVRFNYMGDVMYATRVDEELDHQVEKNNPYGSCFRTFDATNYSLIATIDVKSKSINDLCTDKLDTYLAVVEFESGDIGTDGNVCKLYEIGRVKDDHEQQNDEEEETHDEEDDDDDDDDDDEDDEDIDLDNLLFEAGEEEEGADENGSEQENGEEENNDTDEEEEEADMESVGSDVDFDDNDDDDDDDDVEFDIDNAFFELADL